MPLPCLLPCPPACLPCLQEGILKEHLEAAKARAEEALASATLEERVVLNAQLQEQAKALRKAQVGAAEGGGGGVRNVGPCRLAAARSGLSWASPRACCTGCAVCLQGESFQADVMRQMRERQEAAKRKREAAEKTRYRCAWGRQYSSAGMEDRWYSSELPGLIHACWVAAQRNGQSCNACKIFLKFLLPHCPLLLPQAAGRGG